MKSIDGIIYPDSQDKSQALINLVENFVPLDKWHFKQHTLFASAPHNTLPYVIYNSESCRVKFSLDYSGNGRKLDLWIYYGRLHALDNARVMKWNDIDHYCWHNLELVLKYLDGISSQEAAGTQAKEPQGVQEFLRLELTTKEITQPEWMARLHGSVWGYYGLPLFQLFDLQYPESWRQFTQFVSDYYDIIGRNPAHNPSLDKVC